MAYPSDKPSGNYALRDYNFGVNDTNKLPIDEYLFKNGYKNADESEIDSVPDAHNHNWLFDVLYRNLRYTQQVAEENKTQLETKLATTTNIGQIKVGYGLEITSNGVLSVAKQIAEDANIISYDLPVGSYMLWAGNNTPEYFIEPSGQTLLKSSYPDLWQFAQDNDLIGKLFLDIDDTSFKVVDIRGNFISISNSNENVGTFTSAGLPNITGVGPRFSRELWNGVGASGAIYAATNSTGGNGENGDGGWNGNMGWNFDASRSNPIYGNSNTVTPANWGLKIILKALPTPPVNAVPRGTILTYTGLSAPDGYIIANGAELSRTTFKTLFDWAVQNELIVNQDDVPDTAHGYYGTGDGSTTFTIPDLRGVFTRWADLASNRGGAETRNYQADGLPNITGSFTYTRAYGYSDAFSGAFSTSQVVTTSWSSRGWDWSNRIADFNASRSSSIYGNSQYVQPKSVSMIPILKY